MSHSYASSTQATEGAGAFVQQNPNGLTNAPMREFEIAAHQAALDGSVFHSYHKREASGYYARGALNAVDDQDSGQNSLQRRPSNSRKQVLVAGSSSTPGAAAMAASNQSFASMEMNGSTMSAVGNGSANQTVYGGSHRPGLRVNVPRTNTLAGQAVLGASGLGLIDASDGSLGLDTFLHPNTTPEATLERANGNDASHYPGALSPLSAFSPASGGPHSPSANQFPPSSPFPNSPHSPYPVSPEGHFSSGAISPALPLPAPSPVSLSPQFGPTGSNISPRLPMKPLRGHTPSRSQTQPVGDEGLTSRSLVGKARGKSPAARSNTGTVAPTHATHANHAAFSYSILDPVAQGHSMGATSYNSATSAHQRVPSGGNKASQSTGLARSPSGGVSKRNHGVEDRFYRNRGHSIGNASRNGSADNAVHPYLVTGQRYEGSVVAQAGSVRGHDTGSLGGSRNPSPYIGSSPLPGGLELPGGLALSASNVAMMNASYSDGNTLAPPISVEGAPSRRGSLSSLGDINGPMDVNDNEYHLDMSLSSQLLVPPSTSPHSPHFVNAFGSPHSPQLEISYLGSPSAHQLPPPSPLELTSGASSPAQVLSPWATHHSSPAFLAVGMEQYGLGLANAGGIDVPQFQDLGHGLLSSSPPFAGAPSQELNALDVEQAPGVSQSSFQNQQWLMNKLAQEDAMMIDSATTGANPRNQNGGMGLGFDPMAGNSSAASAADGFSGIHLIPSPMAAGLQLPAQGTHTPEYAMASLPGQPFNYAAQAPQQQVYDVQNALSFDVNLGAMHTASFNDLSPTSQAVADAEGKLAPHTVPPTPSTGTILPWAGQPGVNLAPGGIQQWQEQQQQVAANQVLQPDVTSNGAQTPNTLLVPPVKVPRPAVARRRSYSTYDQPMPSAPVVSELEPMDDVYLGTDGHLRRKNVSASAGMINAHKRARSFNPPPTINVTNWDSRPSSSSMTMGGHGQPPIPAFVQTTRNLQPSPEHRVPSPSNMNTLYDARQHAQTAMLQSQNGALTLNDVYPPRNPAMVVPSHSTLVSPPLPTSSSSSSSASPTPIKVKQQGQRHEVNEEMLGKAFTAKAEYPNPGLRALLEIVRRSPFYMNETMEPMLGTQEAELLLEQVRMIVPNDPRFASRLSENGEPSGLVGGGNNGSADNASRDAQSIYMLFTESNQCLICGKQTDRSGRALGHVRSDIGHRPYHCTCEKCASSNNPRKFFSENLLDDHLKGQVVKQECQVCHNFFRRGGMRRHMNSKHPGVLYKHSGDEGDDES